MYLKVRSLTSLQGDSLATFRCIEMASVSGKWANKHFRPLLCKEKLDDLNFSIL